MRWKLAPTHLHPPGRAGPDPRDLKLGSSPRAEPALFERLDNLFGYLARKFVGSNGVQHQFPICVGESGSAFLHWPLPEPVRRPPSHELHLGHPDMLACARLSSTWYGAAAMRIPITGAAAAQHMTF